MNQAEVSGKGSDEYMTNNIIFNRILDAPVHAMWKWRVGSSDEEPYF